MPDNLKKGEKQVVIQRESKKKGEQAYRTRKQQMEGGSRTGKRKRSA